MKHILFLMIIYFVLLLNLSYVFAENQLRFALHATGSEIIPHVAWGAWVVRPDVLAHAKDADTVFSPIAFAVVGPHIGWKWDDGLVSAVWIELLGGGTLIREDFIPSGDIRTVMLSKYLHMYGETRFDEKVFAPTLTAEFPVTWDGKVLCKFGGEYDASYQWNAGSKNTVRLGPRFSVPVGPLTLALTLDTLDDPRIYAVLNVPF